MDTTGERGRAEQFGRNLREVEARMALTGHAIGCDEGWRELVVELDRRLCSIDPDYYLYRVGRCMGRLVFDAEPSTSALREGFAALIADAVRQSRTTCEVCGRSGEPVCVDGLVEVLCIAHAATAAKASTLPSP